MVDAKISDWLDDHQDYGNAVPAGIAQDFCGVRSYEVCVAGYDVCSGIFRLRVCSHLLYQGCGIHDGCVNGFAAGHPPDDCAGMACTIHHPSSHHMLDWPQRWRPNGILDRICGHGQAHPDPDQFGLWVARDWERFAAHVCDGCCAYEGYVQVGHGNAADLEAELSLLKTVREVIASRGAPDLGPTALETTLRGELGRLRDLGDDY